MTLTLHLVRHGQTLFNRRGLVQGWVDSPLTDLGRTQARAAARALRGRPLVGLYSSTSERAEDTAHVIAAEHRGLAVTRLKELKEMYFGELEARPNAEFETGVDIPSFFAGMFAGTAPGIPGGETGRAFVERVSGAVSSIVAGHPSGGEVAVVSHGVTINMILVASGWTSPGPLGNASISTVQIPDTGPRVVMAVGSSEVPDGLRPD